MADSSLFDFPSPLTGYEHAPGLPEDRNEDGKSMRNNSTGKLSSAYAEFPDPLLRNRRGGL